MPTTEEIIGYAQAAQRVYQIPSSLNLSAAWVESGMGAHTPPGSNNWHGIKDPAGVVTSTQEQTAGGVVYTIQAGFMIFKSPADSFMYYGRLLGLGKPYHNMVAKFLASPRAPADVQALSNALTGVYATALGYGAALIAAQKKYNLYSCDILPSAAVPAPPQGSHPMLTSIWTLLGEAPELIGDAQAAYTAITAFLGSSAGQSLEKDLNTLFHSTPTPGAAVVVEPKTSAAGR